MCLQQSESLGVGKASRKKWGSVEEMGTLVDEGVGVLIGSAGGRVGRKLHGACGRISWG